MEAEALTNFTAITGVTNDRARQYLALTDGNLEQAIELYYASDGADLEPVSQNAPAQALHAPSIPSTSTRPSRRRQGFEDNSGIVHIESESEPEASDDDSFQQTSTGRVRPQSGVGATSRTEASAEPETSTGRAGLVEDDEAMARRLQEELYGATGAGDVFDSEGIRAPIARTTETLVGPGTYDIDAGDEDDMQAAVLEQMRARRQPRPSGTVPLAYSSFY